jgi:hypothetical protein
LLAAALAASGIPAAAAGDSAAREPVPASLTAAESNAEDIVDVALAHDRAGVRAIASQLKATANGGAAGDLRRAGIPKAQIALFGQRADRLASLAPGGSYLAIVLAANAVSQLMAGLYAHFADPVPPAIQALDYLDREAQFRSLAREPAKVAAAVERLSRTWARVRPKVLAAGGTAEAVAYSRHVAAMRRLDPAAAAGVQAEAVRGLALVDRLEQVFG